MCGIKIRVYSEFKKVFWLEFAIELSMIALGFFRGVVLPTLHTSGTSILLDRLDAYFFTHDSAGFFSWRVLANPPHHGHKRSL